MSYTDGWSKELLENRGKKIREYLVEKNIEALVVLDPLNIVYTSGFFLDVATWERPVATVIPTKEEPFMVVCELSSNHVKYSLENGRGWIEDVRIYVEHPKQVNRFYFAHDWARMISEAFEERKIRKGRIGVDRNPKELEGRVKPHLPELSFVDESKLLREMRLIKCEEELNLIRKAGELSDWGQERFKEVIAEGKRQVSIESEAAHLISEEAARRYPDYMINVWTAFTGTGPFAAMPHGSGGYSGRKIQKGETLVNAIVLRLNHYGVENERTYIVGEPSEKQKKLFNIMTEAQKRAIEMCVVGNKVSDIDAAAQSVIEKAGCGDYIMHRTGHGVGLGGHEYWDDMAFNHRRLEAGMVTSVEPGIYVYGYGGFRHSDTVIVGKEKAEPATKYTTKMEDLII